MQFESHAVHIYTWKLILDLHVSMVVKGRGLSPLLVFVHVHGAHFDQSRVVVYVPYRHQSRPGYVRGFSSVICDECVNECDYTAECIQFIQPDPSLRIGP